MQPILLTVIDDGSGHSSTFISPSLEDAANGVARTVVNALVLAGAVGNGEVNVGNFPTELDVRIYRGLNDVEKSQLVREVKIFEGRFEVFPDKCKGIKLIADPPKEEEQQSLVILQ